MSDIAIKIEGISKKYAIGKQKSSSLRDTLSGLFQSKQSQVQDFWAINDINFEVKEGEALGIIGKNGAGKSTLLKVISRITAPTTGKITIHGRVASLLEVGTGFHPELTGRENIYLNGTILGMRRPEVKAKLDEIIDFSGVEKFIDTAVKHYSSGMYVRLAFAVAAHLEPEILIIDEVLAVGDADFQKRCLGKMGKVAESGRTVLFVSHNMNAVEQLCKSAMLIKSGKLEVYSDNVRQVISDYLYGDKEGTDAEWVNSGNELQNEHHTIERVGVYDASDRPLTGAAANNEPIFIKLKGEIKEENNLLNLGFVLFDDSDRQLFISYVKDLAQEDWPALKKGPFELVAKIPPHLLNEGNYRIEMVSNLHFTRWLIEPGGGGPVINFEVRGGLSESPYWVLRRGGFMAPVLHWESV